MSKYPLWNKDLMPTDAVTIPVPRLIHASQVGAFSEEIQQQLLDVLAAHRERMHSQIEGAIRDALAHAIRPILLNHGVGHFERTTQQIIDAVTAVLSEHVIVREESGS